MLHQLGGFFVLSAHMDDLQQDVLVLQSAHVKLDTWQACPGMPYLLQARGYAGCKQVAADCGTARMPLPGCFCSCWVQRFAGNYCDLHHTNQSTCALLVDDAWEGRGHSTWHHGITVRVWEKALCKSTTNPRCTMH